MVNDDSAYGSDRAKNGRKMGDKIKNKSLFTPEEDERLKKLVKFFGKRKDINWKYIAQQMGTRSVRQCKERWVNYLDTKMNKGDFTPEENLFILQRVAEVGNKWSYISSLLKNRTSISIKLQYNKLKRRNANIDNVLTLDTEPYASRRCRLLQEVAKPTKSEPSTETEILDTIINTFDFDENENFDIKLI